MRLGIKCNNGGGGGPCLSSFSSSSSLNSLGSSKLSSWGVFSSGLTGWMKHQWFTWQIHGNSCRWCGNTCGFFRIKLVFCWAPLTFSPPFAKTFVSLFVAFGLVGFIAVLPIELVMAGCAFNIGFNPDCVIGAGLIASTAGKAVLSIAILVGCIFSIIGLLAETAVIGWINEGGNAD